MYGRIFGWRMGRKIRESRERTRRLLFCWCVEKGYNDMFPILEHWLVFWTDELVWREIRERRTVSKEEAYAHFDRLYWGDYEWEE